MSPLDTVRELYAAFGRGDLPTILAALADDVVWEYGASPNPAPWLQPRRGREAVVGFFASLAENLEFQRFEPRAIVADGPLVVALVDVAATVKSTGRTFTEEDEVHVWRFDAQGRVARFAHRCDTWGQALAWRGDGAAERPLQVPGDRVGVLAEATTTGGA